jgi:hypothetical protein
MSKIFVCGAELLTVPVAGVTTANTARIASIDAFLRFEFLPLFNDRYLVTFGYDPASDVALFFSGSLRSPIPISANAIQHANVVVTKVATAAAISSFAADMIICIPGGITVNASIASDIAALRIAASAAGVLWREDAAAIVTPALFALSTIPPSVASTTPVTGTIVGYLTAPTLEFAIGAGAFQSLPVGNVVTNISFSFQVPAGLAQSANTTLTIRDSVTPAVSTTFKIYPAVGKVIG